MLSEDVIFSETYLFVDNHNVLSINSTPARIQRDLLSIENWVSWKKTGFALDKCAEVTLRGDDHSFNLFGVVVPIIEYKISENKILSLGPRHHVRDKFIEVHFLADVDKLVRELRENKTEGENICKIKTSVKWYAKNVRKTPMDSCTRNPHA